MRTLKIVFIFTILFAFAITLVSAQTTSVKPRPQSQPTPAASRPKTRTRHAAKPVTQQPEKQVDVKGLSDSNSSAESSQAQVPASSPEASSTPKTTDKPAEKPLAEVAAETPDPKDPILALNDQIEAAATPQERLRLQLKLAELFVADNKKSEAIAELHTASSVEAFDPQSFYNIGNALARMGDTDGAITSYRKAINQRNGGYSRALNNLGVVLLRVGRWDEAFDALSSALKVENFRYAEASYNLGRLYAARGQMDLAVREWRRAVAVDPHHSAAAQSLARAGNEGRITVEEPSTVTRGTNTLAATIKPATPAIAERPKASPSPNSGKPLSLDATGFTLLQKARTAAEKGNKLEAVDNYQRLLARQSGYFGPANLELSFVLIGLKRNDEALANLLQVTNREGLRYPISYYHLARIYEMKGDLKLAEDAFVQTIAAYGNENNQFLLDLSRVREKQGNFRGALDAMEQYIARVKKDGQDVMWSEERLAALRQKVGTPQPK
ncbi:MAG TPA: tetratricopeptide repeat protein [Pyrinomonadaceae bacterium]